MFQEDVIYKLNTLQRAVQELKNTQDAILNKLNELSTQQYVGKQPIIEDNMEVVHQVVDAWFKDCMITKKELPSLGLPVTVDRQLLMLLQHGLNRSATFKEKLEMRTRALVLITNES